MNPGKHERQAELLSLIGQQRISSQRGIVELLLSKGVTATQSSVSRDVRELGLLKVGGRYVRAVAAPAPRDISDNHDRIMDLIIDAEPAGANLIVVRTATGSAGSVAVALDEARLRDVVGTLAGDDTIFVAVRGRSAQGRVIARLNDWMSGRSGGRRAIETRLLPNRG